jgi:hypothetical protein
MTSDTAQGRNNRMPAPRPALRGLAVLTTLATLVGCGGDEDDSRPEQRPSTTVSGEQRGILDTVDALQTASRNGDGEAICDDVFTPQLVQSIESAAKRSCGEEVREQLFTPNAEISLQRDIMVSGNQATATIREQNGNVSKLFLVKQGGQWRIDRLEPQNGP